MAIALSKTTSRIIWLVIFVIVLAMTLLTSSYLAQAIICQRWPMTNGVILSAQEAVHNDTNPQSKTVTQTYELKLAYSYSVNGISHIGTRVSFGDFAGFSGSKREADERMGRYFANKQISVYYKPSAPEISVLETQLTWPSIILPSAFALASILCWVGFRKGWILYLGRRPVVY